MSVKKIAITGVGCVPAKYLPEALRSHGYEPVFILDPAEYVGEGRAALESCACHPEPTAQALAGVFAITSLFDEVFPHTQELAHRHGLRHPDPVLAALADKSRVIELVPEYGPPTTVLSPEQLSTLDLKLDREMVLKPSICTGALGVTFLPAGTTAERIRQVIVESEVPAARTQKWLLQEPISGELISMEGYVRGGVVSSVGFSLRTRIGLTEMANLFPADHVLPDPVRQTCLAAMKALSQRSGFHNGYFHAEFLYRGERAYLVDANVGRIAGGPILEQIALAHGIDPGEIARHVVLLPLDVDVPEPAYRPIAQARITKSAWYALERGGVVREIRLPSDLSSLHTQRVVAGTRVAALGESDYAWIGMLAGLDDSAIHDIRRLVIETDDGPQPPAFVAP